MKEWIAVGIHGMGGHLTRFGPMTHFYDSHGIPMITFDLMGFGRTTHANRGDIDSFDNYVHEVELICRDIRAKKPHAGIILAGENIGGLIALLTALDQPRLTDALILMNPQLDATRPFEPKTRWLLNLFSFIRPGHRFALPAPDETQCDDEKWCKMLQEDPDENHEITARFWWAMIRAMIEMRAGISRLKLPVLIQLSTRATRTNPKAAEELFRKLPGMTKHLQVFDMPEEMLICKGREDVFKKQLNFLSGL